MQATRSVRVRGTDYPVRLPSGRDPRLHLAATITSIQVMGQAFLGWELSIAQILVSLLTCALIEVPMVFWERKEIVWPASALLTGNGVALVLRVNGTEHGDWWSMNGWYVFAATAGLALLSKHVLRFRGRPVVNPSNLGLVACFLLLGTTVVNPLDFWWGPPSVELVVVYLILAAGALAVTRRLGLLPMSLAFWAVLAGSLAVVSASGHCITARWSVTPVCGADFWWIVTTSPEVVIFMLFMITDPMTSPAARGPRMVFGATVGLTSALLMAPDADRVRRQGGAPVRPGRGVRSAPAAGRARRAPVQRRCIWVRPRESRPRCPSLWSLSSWPACRRGPPTRSARTSPPGHSPAVPSSRSRRTPSRRSRISADVETVVGDAATTQADAMATDLVAALIIELDAAAADDTEMAESAIAGERLEEFPEPCAGGSGRVRVDGDGARARPGRPPGHPALRHPRHRHAWDLSTRHGLRHGERQRHLAAHRGAGDRLGLSRLSPRQRGPT